MKVLRETTRDHLNLAWLRSEAWKLNVEPSFVDERASLSDVEQNRRRAELLHAYRAPILDQLPADARYHEVRIEEGDLPKLYILTVWDWFLDTGRTYQLTNTQTHLKPDRGGIINGDHLPPVNHAAGVAEKRPFLTDYDAENSDEHLILVAADDQGPYTIIDGTHRATALLEQHHASPNLPWRGILITSPSMNTNRWHIGFDAAAHLVRELGQLADSGALW